MALAHSLQALEHIVIERLAKSELLEMENIGSSTMSSMSSNKFGSFERIRAKM
jgi:hypothetical protein